MEMTKYTLKRLLMVLPVILGVMLIVFTFQAFSNDDPVTQILGSGATEAAREAKREELGLNDPIVVQFGRYVFNFFTKGSLGTSYKSAQPVIHEIGVRFPITARLAVIAVAIGILIGIPLGIWAAVRQYTVLDSAIVTFSVIIESMPQFWLALVLVSLFSVKLKLLPLSYNGSFSSWILPVITVAIGSISMIIRVTRSSMLETIRQDYVRTARAKGQTEFNITIRHVLRNSLIPIINAVGNTIGNLLGGALIIETIFGLPGIGKYAVDSITARDYPAVLGSVVMLAITYTFVNLVIDLVYAMVSPTVKTSLISAERIKKHRRQGRKAQKGAA